MATKKGMKSAIIVLVLVIAGMGFYIVSSKTKNNEQETYVSTETSTSSSAQTGTVSKPVTSATPKMEDGTAPSVTTAPTTTFASCQKQWNDKLTKDKTEYEKGVILVGFKKEINLSSALAILKTFSLTVKADSNNEDAYSNAHLLSVIVPSGKEVEYICKVATNTNVRYTNVNAYLFLHD